MTSDSPPEYAYLKIPAAEELRSCAGLVFAGMAARARVGVGGLEEAIAVLESVQSGGGPIHFRFSLADGRVLAEMAEPAGDGSEGQRWRTVAELAS